MRQDPDVTLESQITDAIFDGNMNALARLSGVAHDELLKVIERVAEAHFPGRQFFTWSEPNGIAKLFLNLHVRDSVRSPETDISLEAARRIDPSADIGDELAIGIPYLMKEQEAAQVVDELHADDLAMFCDRMEFRADVRRELLSCAAPQLAPTSAVSTNPAPVDALDEALASYAGRILGHYADENGLNALEPMERSLVLATGAFGIVGNGGFQYFYECGLEPYATAAACDLLGFTTMANAIRETTQVFPAGNVPLDRAECLRYVGGMAPEVRERWSQLERDVWATNFSSLLANRIRTDLSFTHLEAIKRVDAAARSGRVDGVVLVWLLACYPFHEFVALVPDAEAVVGALDSIGLHSVSEIVRERLRWFRRGAPLVQDSRYRVENAIYSVRDELPPLLSRLL